ncbi:MAG: Nif3-like dinuclear metal center hexameric protein [Ignavibacteriales bacterium]|nr:Nif3-like dinuclear metal center hexameric protein [Ignavibacteriales bacterium]
MSLHVSNIVQLFEDWAPKWVAWEKDNVGLQVGDKRNKVTKILVTLDVTRQIVHDAISQKVELIVSHHPLLFRPPSAIIANDPIGELVLLLAEHKIALFSAHTNLDYAQGGVSFSLAKVLGLKNIRFLTLLKNSLAKIVVFVPEGHVERVRNAMTQAGAGVIGNYSSCSFGTKGTGTFNGSAASIPFLGKRGNLESVEETRLEMIASRAIVSDVVAAVKAVHPYEEPAYDIDFVENLNPNFGMGALGMLPKPQSLELFLKSIKRTLGVGALRYTGSLAHKIQNVAVCGGAGADLLPDALAAKADVFVTADVRYHTFQKATDGIALIDAGHWETEQTILKPIAARLRSAARAAHEPLTVFMTKHKTNPIKIL